VLGVFIDLCFGLLAGAMRDRVLDNPRTRIILDRVSATVFGLIAVALLVEVGLQLLGH
jgi:threonine/homoserine/homoserine lactone efflux protein